jgi:hypothetical protein
VSLADNSYGADLDFDVIKEVNFSTNVYTIRRPSRLNWINGTAEFGGLSIKRAGMGYHLLFSTDLMLSGSRDCQSGAIDVLVGNPMRLRIIEEPVMSIVYGGKVFLHQPILHILDKGNNVVRNDSNSWVAAFLYNNPSNTILLPREPIIIRVKEGVANFKDMRIDKAGEGYRLKYVFLKGNNDDVREAKPTDITVLGKFFIFDKQLFDQT